MLVFGGVDPSREGRKKKLWKFPTKDPQIRSEDHSMISFWKNEARSDFEGELDFETSPMFFRGWEMSLKWMRFH